MIEKNRISWNRDAASYSAMCHADRFMNRIIANPSNAFHATTWGMINAYVPELKGKRVCVPSSGDNHAVFAFAMLGAHVTSCDISENQLANAERVAKEHGWDTSIDFICADTMALDVLQGDAYDFVYTSNGVHVWLDDLNGMYNSIYRIMKPGGVYIMYDIHPFQRPFNDDAKVAKPYDAVGPHEADEQITFAWRAMDLLNAMLDAGLSVKHIEEMYAQKDYEWPFWIGLEDMMKGATATPEEVDAMHDWHNNPIAALPNWLGVAAVK